MKTKTCIPGALGDNNLRAPAWQHRRLGLVEDLRSGKRYNDSKLHKHVMDLADFIAEAKLLKENEL